MILEYRGKEIKKTFFTFFLVAVILVAICLTIFGAEITRNGRVTPDVDPNNLRVREDATISSGIVGYLSGGDEVIVLGEKNGQEVQSGNTLWYKIKFGSITGYAYSQFIEIIPEDTTTNEPVGDLTTGPEETNGQETTSPEETTGQDSETPDETTGDGATGDQTGIPEETTAGETSIPGETTAPDDKPEKPPEINFEEYLDEQKFPESYKSYLRELHELYPNWVFKAHHTGYDFEYAVSQQLNKSLVENTFPSSWKSVEGDAYIWELNQWKVFDGDRWVRASREIIRYYMDPRNFLGENTVFQFLDQSYDPNVQNIDGVKRIIAGTFMENDVIDTDGKNLNYANAIFEAGKKYSVNPYVLSSMIIIEVGSQGSSIISGNVSGYTGYFNYFNIGAYSANGMTPVQRGLWYAKGGNNGSTTYLRPWNTRLKAIEGGAYFYSYGYVSAGQNTLYLKRFNVQGNNPFTHQYMTSVYGSSTEAAKLAKGYTQELRETPLSFYIPIFDNMPEQSCAKPTLDGSPNMKLASLSVKGYELTPDFDTETLEYMLVVPPTVNSIAVEAVPMDSTAVIAGAGELTVNSGTNVYEIKVTAGNGTVRVYKLTVAKEGSENFGELTFTDKYMPNNYIIYGIAPGTTVGSFKTSFVSAGNVIVLNSAGAEKGDEDVMATEDTIIVNSTLGVKYGEYKASVKGDVNCDGRITISDLLKLRNKILGSDTLSQPQTYSGDIDAGGAVNISDLLKVRNHILGTALIS